MSLQICENCSRAERDYQQIASPQEKEFSKEEADFLFVLIEKTLR